MCGGQIFLFFFFERTHKRRLYRPLRRKWCTSQTGKHAKSKQKSSNHEISSKIRRVDQTLAPIFQSMWGIDPWKIPTPLCFTVLEGFPLLGVQPWFYHCVTAPSMGANGSTSVPAPPDVTVERM